MVAIFSLRMAATPSLIASAFASSGMSSLVRIQSRILFASSTVLIITFLALAAARALSLNNLAAEFSISLADSRSISR
ncbi:hypothetical protein AU197_18375 [Mycobacterium sp. IS-1590]|nr:hypothetical protein AU197_18375 [Mycobacterium sp. IS-1590]